MTFFNEMVQSLVKIKNKSSVFLLQRCADSLRCKKELIQSKSHNSFKWHSGSIALLFYCQETLLYIYPRLFVCFKITLLCHIVQSSKRRVTRTTKGEFKLKELVWMIAEIIELGKMFSDIPSSGLR